MHPEPRRVVKAPVPTPLDTLLQQLVQQTEVPRTAAWATALLSRGEGASGPGAGRDRLTSPETTRKTTKEV
jgi:hypothetical protein